MSGKSRGARLIDDPAKGAVKAPWLSWGPYLWANGATKRRDGFSYAECDFGKDGTHHAPPGIDKLGQQLLRFFQTDSTTQPWFLANAARKADSELFSIIGLRQA